MPIQYAGGTNVNSLFTQSSSSPTRREIVDGIVAAMTTAGWSVISGGGTGDVMMESATTPASQSLKMRARIYDPGSGTDARIKLRNAGGTIIQTGDLQLVSSAGRKWRVIANQYQVFVFAVSVINAPCLFAAWGVPFIPPSHEGVITECIWGWGSSNNASDTGNMRPCLRNYLGMWVNFSTPNWFCIINGSTWELNNSNQGNGNLGLPGLIVTWAGLPVHDGYVVITDSSSRSHYRYHNDQSLMCEPLLAFGSALNSESRIRGQLWDAVVTREAYNGDRTFSIDGKTFYSVTHNNYGVSFDTPSGTLLVRVPTV